MSPRFPACSCLRMFPSVTCRDANSYPFQQRTIFNGEFLIEVPVCLYITYNFLNNVVLSLLYNMLEQCKFIILCCMLLRDFQYAGCCLKLTCNLKDLCYEQSDVVIFDKSWDKWVSSWLIAHLICLALKGCRRVLIRMSWGFGVASLKLLARMLSIGLWTFSWEISYHTGNCEMSQLQVTSTQWQVYDFWWGCPCGSETSPAHFKLVSIWSTVGLAGL